MKEIYIGVDIGGMSLKVGFVTKEGKILHKFSFPFSREENQEKTITYLGERINSELEQQNISKKDVKAIGVGCPGSINSDDGICCYNNNLGWLNLKIADILKEVTGFETKVSNDANVAMLGEAIFGAAKNYKDAVLLTLGTGVGGGLFLNGKLYEGYEGKGAELGHTIIEMNGLPCTCGLHGCLETYASVSALIRQTKEAMNANQDSLMWEYVEGDINKVNGKTTFECSKKGDKTAIEVVDTYENYLTIGLLNFCNIFRPEVILIGGGLSNQKEYLTDALTKKLEAHNYGFQGTPKVKILVTNLGNDAGVLGAAALNIK